ncbi:MAG: hypothetical protein ACH37Z_04175 [Anaerolineae bacterium]
MSQLQSLNGVIEVFLVALAGWIFKLVRSNMLSIVSARNVTTLSRLSASAIDYVEHVGLRQHLDPNMEPGRANLDKLGVATTWLVQELKRANVTLKPDEAAQWIKSELQRRTTEVPPSTLISREASESIALVSDLVSKGRLVPPTDTQETDFITQWASDQLITRLAEAGTKLGRDEALIWARTAWLQAQRTPALLPKPPGNAQLPDPPLSGTLDEQLKQLASEALSFVQQLQTQGLTVGGSNIGWHLLTSRLLTEAARRRVEATVDQLLAAAQEVDTLDDV